MKNNSKFSDGDANAGGRGKYQALPKGWQCVKLGDLGCKTVAGGTPSTKNSNYWNGDILWMASGELNYRHINNVKGRITKLGLDKSSAAMIPKHCVLIGLAGQGKTRGTVAINNIPLCTNQSIAAIYPSPLLYYKYLYQNLFHRYSELRKLSTGDGGRGGLNLTLINNLRIAFPPLPKQKAIVSILETWDTAIEKTERLIAAKEKHFKYLLKTLISDQQNNPDWKKVNLGDILSYEQPTKYIVRTTDYKNSGNIAVLTANKSFILGYTDEQDNIFDKENVIIFDDFTTDKKYVDFPFKVKSSALKILKLKDEKINLFFLFHVMNLIKLPLGGHKRYWISEYQHIAIKLPPLKGQEKLAKILHMAKQEITTLQNISEKYRTQKRGLMQKLLKGA